MTRITAKDLQRANVPVPKKHKYGAKKTAVDGITFASKREAKRYGELKLRAMANDIFALEIQPRFPLHVNDVEVAVYVADFAYWHDGKHIVEDAKGFCTPVYKLKKRMTEAQYGIKIVEI